ncbi:MAG: DUF1800 domain-containing protein [Pirellulaceae bacterium]|nr:DUF1800 domain-containing protein [Pirellulaceae bacterium]
MQVMQSANPFHQVDPQWAWSAWTPTQDQPWDTMRAGHLYRRAAFGADHLTLKAAAAGSLSATLDALLDTSQSDPVFQQASQQLAQSALGANDPKALSVWWLHDMFHTPTPLLEKMTLFWHGHFATGAEKVKETQVMLDQNRLIRRHALGSVRAMVHGIAKDPAMLVYLDSAVNRKAHPNENFARELMELFCLGEGNYSEQDVQQLARCFTGWEVRRNQFRFNNYQHDAGKKSLLGSQNIDTGEQAVDVVLDNPQAARFVVGKLFRFFIADEPSPPLALLEPLAQQLVTEQWQVAGVVRRMLGSQLMFSDIVRGRKIRSPIDWAFNWMKASRISTNLKKLSELLAELGQSVFFPPNVKGWDGGRAWINSSTLVGRTNLINQVMRDGATRWDGGTIEDFWRRERVSSSEGLVAWIQRVMLAVPLSDERRQTLIQALESTGGFQRRVDCLVLAAAFPEMQLM